MMVWLKQSDGLPGQQLHLVVARNVLNPDEMKYFIAEAPPGTHIATLLLVAFSRWRVERCFQDQKQEVGLDQWEGRQYLSIKRHLIVTSLSYLFLARTRDRLRGEKTAVTIPQIRKAVSKFIDLWWLGLEAPQRLVDNMPNTSRHWQHKNAAARVSHRKRTLKKLHAAGHYLKTCIKCL